MRKVFESLSSQSTRSFATSTVDTRWLITGVGMKTSSAFFILLPSFFFFWLTTSREFKVGLNARVWFSYPFYVQYLWLYNYVDLRDLKYFVKQWYRCRRVRSWPCCQGVQLLQNSIAVSIGRDWSSDWHCRITIFFKELFVLSFFF